ncbi:ABC transporter substrate-binding protein [Aeromicrobium sp. Leaf350]|uniref:ABC transporter substrate-binding protein n=1 Tax=Aeromicrobium sp. Leaf350 TaxID=2876565 RepID=UPI001E44BE8C|nr:ABC transporter substrate-binding protein [Aeromicrobium sp. Leaf350]
MSPVTSRRPRRTLGAALALVLTAGLVACGGSSDAGDGPVAAVPLPEAEGTTEYPLTLDTWLGESTLEERPERIAVVGFSSNLDALEAIGVTPVYYGGRDAEKGWAWNDPAYLEEIGVTDVQDDVLNFEGIAAAEPDLIVSFNAIIEQADYDKLADIAPVIDLTEDPGVGDKVDWREVQRQLGEALDLSAAADQAVADAEATIAEVAASHPEYAGKTSTIMYDYGSEFGMSYYTVTGGPTEGVMLDLGFVPNPLAENFTTDDVVSEENQALLDGDVLVVIYTDEKSREFREAQPLFQAIPAVAEGRYESLVFQEDSATDQLMTSDGQLVENAVWVLRRGASAIALPWAADKIANGWLGGVDLS